MFLKELKKRVKTGGFLFLSSISKHCMSYFLTILMGEKILKIVPDGTHDYHKYINIEDINKIIIDDQFDLI